MEHGTRDLPQASRLPRVRALLAAIAAGHDRDLRAAGEAIGLSARHAHYYGLAATDTLGLATLAPATLAPATPAPATEAVTTQGARLELTALGRALLATRERSQDERTVWRQAILDSVSVTSIAPDLLDEDGPTAVALTQRMIHAGLSPATARRRASTLLSWRRYALSRQTALPLPIAKVQPTKVQPAKKRRRAS